MNGALARRAKPAGDFGFADAGGADHEDVLRRDLRAQVLVHLLAPPAISQGDRHRSLGRFLPDDVLVELFDDFARESFATWRYSSSMVRLRFV